MATLFKPAERTARVVQKRQLILSFLREEIYTTREVVQELLGVTPSPAKATLAAMARDGLLRCEQVECPNGWRPWLWGITAEGQAMAFDPGTQAHVDKVFEPGRIGLTVLNHTIHLQLARIRAQRHGWTDWISGDRMGKWQAGEGRPDAIAVSPSGERLAVEMELTMKTTKLYQSVLFSRLRDIKAGKFDRCVWISPDADRCKRLRSIILGIDQFSREFAGRKQTIIIDPSTHHPKLAFVSFDDWPLLAD